MYRVQCIHMYTRSNTPNTDVFLLELLRNRSYLMFRSSAAPGWSCEAGLPRDEPHGRQKR